MDCTATNKKGSWPFIAPGSITFKKSDQDLTISCNDGGEVITRTMTPTRGGMIWGNVLIGGIIGGGLDALTDAHWNMSDSLIIYRNNCGQNKQSPPSQYVKPPTQRLQPTNPYVEPSSQIVQPSNRTLQPTDKHAQPSSRTVQSTPQYAQPSSRTVQPTYNYSQPSRQTAPTSRQNGQGNQATDKTNYIVAPRPSSLKEIDARDKEDCELISSITKNTGGTDDVSKSVKYAKKAALTEAAKTGADSYFISNAEMSIFGASVTLEALDCE